MCALAQMAVPSSRSPACRPRPACPSGPLGPPAHPSRSHTLDHAPSCAAAGARALPSYFALLRAIDAAWDGEGGAGAGVLTGEALAPMLLNWLAKALAAAGNPGASTWAPSGAARVAAPAPVGEGRYALLSSQCGATLGARADRADASGGAAGAPAAASLRRGGGKKSRGGAPGGRAPAGPRRPPCAARPPPPPLAAPQVDAPSPVRLPAPPRRAAGITLRKMWAACPATAGLPFPDHAKAKWLAAADRTGFISWDAHASAPNRSVAYARLDVWALAAAAAAGRGEANGGGGGLGGA
jgi:hypothetical protein